METHNVQDFDAFDGKAFGQPTLAGAHAPEAEGSAFDHAGTAVSSRIERSRSVSRCRSTSSASRSMAVSRNAR